jgi:uncharacterized protein
LMRPGRPRCPRRVEKVPTVSYFKPQGVPLRELELVLLSLEELEAIRLVDLEGLNQEDAAQRMGISRRALWADIQNARRKIADTLVHGKAIEICGGDYTVGAPVKCTCAQCHSEWETSSAAGPSVCPKCGSGDVESHPDIAADEGKGRCGQSRCCKRNGPGAAE